MSYQKFVTLVKKIIKISKINFLNQKDFLPHNVVFLNSYMVYNVMRKYKIKNKDLFLPPWTFQKRLGTFFTV